MSPKKKKNDLACRFTGFGRGCYICVVRDGFPEKRSSRDGAESRNKIDMVVKGAIFDLDGTLIDSLEDVANLANDVLSIFGFERKAKEEYRYFAGQGAYSLMASSSGSKDNALIVKMVEEFERVYANSQNISKVFDGITKTLEAIHSRGIKMAVLSNKPEHLTRLCVDKNFDSSMFKAVFGQKKAERLSHILKVLWR